MHFLVSALGSAGDVHPFIVISKALQSRGHDVHMIALAPFRERIERAGIAFTPLGTVEDYQRLVGRPEMWRPASGARLLVNELLHQLPEAQGLTAALVRPGATVLVGSTLSWATRLVQERFALPGATIHLSPFVLPSANRPPILPGGVDLARWPAWLVRGMQSGAERLVLDRWIGPPLNRLRRDLRLPPVQHVLSRWMHSPDLVIGAWPAWFAPPQADWPQPIELIDFPLFDEGGAGLDDALRAFLAAGDAPIGITPGSAMAHGQAFFARAIDACASIRKRAVLITPYVDQLPRRLPIGMHHVAWAPFSQLLPRLSALVHHGGIGTSAQALAAGVPQLVVPFAHDQFDNAARLERLGVARALRVLSQDAGWRAALRSLIDNSDVVAAAGRCAAHMASSAAPATAIANRLEQLGRDRLGS